MAGTISKAIRRGAAVALALLALAPGGAAAANLESSFGSGGILTAPIDFGAEAWDTAPAEIARSAADRRLYTLAGTTISAFTEAGAAVTAFGGGAVAVADPQGDQLRLTGIATDPLGRVLVAGTAAPTFQPPAGTAEYELPQYAFVARYLPTGAIDPSFGEGGFVRTDFGLPKALLGPYTYLYAGQHQVQLLGIAIDGAGRPVLTGTRWAHAEGCKQGIGSAGGTTIRKEPFLARLSADGSLDPSYGGGAPFGIPGLTTISGQGEITAPVLDPVGNALVVTGTDGCFESGEPAVFLARFDGTGALDPTLGADGWKRLASGTNHVSPAVAVDSSGRPVLIGYRDTGKGAAHPYVNLVFRMHKDGSRDKSFAGNGVAALDFGGAGDVELHGLVTSGAATYVAGTWWPRGRNHLTGPGHARRLFIGRLTGRGTEDLRFGHGGWLATRLAPSSEAVGRSPLVEPNATPILAGTFASPLVPGRTGLGLAAYSWGKH